MISAFHYESDGDLDGGDLEASVLDQYTAFEMLSPNEKFKKYVERKRFRKNISVKYFLKIIQKNTG